MYGTPDYSGLIMVGILVAVASLIVGIAITYFVVKAAVHAALREREAVPVKPREFELPDARPKPKPAAEDWP
ncbi:hypothetical protein KPL76_06110 [Subtercola sp. PAMC28395]|uniref:hypothetical protein n=1 Tax=Subtercola sp. PAMC28395 TaxID=2846775 RepID=UPI001C0BBC45|nr:hypothetical protein [Subtercola sp. PAMC28395]QWT24927.1 hypothetical protein KPL76_06110 [Subtercola sp. PAMC28395]